MESARRVVSPACDISSDGTGSYAKEDHLHGRRPSSGYGRFVRVAIVVNSLGGGGTERSTAVLARWLAPWGVTPAVICLYRAAEGDHDALVAAGVDVRTIRRSGWIARILELRRVLVELDVDVVHTAIFEADVIGRIAGRLAGIPVLSSLVNTPYDPARLMDPNLSVPKLRVVKAIDVMTARVCATHFHAVSEGVKRSAVETMGLSPSRVTVVERGRDAEVLSRCTEERRRATRKSLKLDDSDDLVLALGRQEWQKAHDVLVRALPLVLRRRPRVIVAIAGRRGSNSEPLRRAIDESGVGDAVRVLGYRDDAADLLCAADVFVMPSRYEGTAGAALEAMALQVPVVASEVTGVEGVLGRDVAALVPPGDEAALAEAILEVLEGGPVVERRVAKARQQFTERFEAQRYVAEMTALYDEVARIARRGQRGLNEERAR